jgi:O-succinylbenzoic acid--CoA ligase
MSSQVATGRVVDAHKPCIKVLPYRQLRISSDGEILAKGKVLFKGYITGTKLHLPSVVIPAKAGIHNKNNLWFPTGDIGQLDKDGCLTVAGRRDNMFISGGENIHPEEIEKVLLSIEGIQEAIIVPKEDKEFGQRPVAFIKYAGKPLAEDYLIRCLESLLPRFKIPVSFFPWPQHLMTQGLKISRQEFLKTLLRRQ